MEAFIVGGGSSLKKFDFTKLANKNTIVVNKAIVDVPNPKHFITMDYTFLKKIRDDVQYITNRKELNKKMLISFKNKKKMIY